METLAWCTAADYRQALTEPGFGELFDREFLYLSSRTGSEEDLWFHSGECARDGAGCDLPTGALHLVTRKAEFAELGGSAYVRLTACPSASTLDQAAVAAAGALQVAWYAMLNRPRTPLRVALHCAVELAMPPQAHPGLWQRSHPSPVPGLLRLADQVSNPGIDRVRGEVRKAVERTQGTFTFELDPVRAPLGTGRPWWVALPAGRAVDMFAKGEEDLVRSQLVMKAPLRLVASQPHDGHLLVWQVPQSFADVAGEVQAAWPLGPVGPDEGAELVSLRALAETGVSDARTAADLASAFLAAQY